MAQTTRPLSRRLFLQTAGGVLLGFHLSSNEKAFALASNDQINFNTEPDSFIRICPDNSVEVIIHKAEMGQGVHTSLPMLIAEELEANWKTIKVVSAPVSADYYHTKWGPFQGTGASSSISSCWQQLRIAGATAKEMLIVAAASVWKVSPKDCYANEGYIQLKSSTKRLSYAQLTNIASKRPIPSHVKLKKVEDFKIIGTSQRHLDVVEKTTGKATYGIDVVVPNMLIAVLARPNVFGGKVAKYDDTQSQKVRGVKSIIVIDQGIAVIADSFWAADKAKGLLTIQWDSPPSNRVNTSDLRKKYAQIANTKGLVARKERSSIPLDDPSLTRIKAIYELPYLAHAPMEPLNCVADVRKNSCTLWVGTQMQTTDQKAVSDITGLPIDKIEINTVLLGSSFGRRANPHADFVKEAVNISKVVSQPIKLMWTREDDIRGGYYRPMHYSKIEAKLTKDGMPATWHHRMVSKSIVKNTPFEGALTHDGIDHLSVEGASNHPYSIGNQQVENHDVDDGIPVLWWRSVGHSFTAFVVESFMDEISTRGDIDPFTFRKSLLGKHPAHLKVLKTLKQTSSWATPPPSNIYRGMALHKSFGSISGQVVEIEKDKAGKLKLHRVFCVIDCGLAVNPDTVKAQMESGIVYGLSAALFGEITVEEGQVQQLDFQSYPVLRMNDMPIIEVSILDSIEDPKGVGEVGTPPVAAALCNAIYAATGERIRTLPIKNFNDITFV